MRLRLHLDVVRIPHVVASRDREAEKERAEVSDEQIGRHEYQYSEQDVQADSQ